MTLNKFRAAAWLACAVLATAYAGSSLAAPINYGDFSDIPPGSVMYLDVTEDSGTDTVPPPLFGAPSITGNLLDFDPGAGNVNDPNSNGGMVFSAYASGSGPFSDTTDGQLSFTMMSSQGFNSVGFYEDGDFALDTLGGAARVRASLVVNVDILEVDGSTLLTPIPTSGVVQFVRTTPYSGSPQWSNSLLVNLAPLIADLNPIRGVTKAEISLNNRLEALTLANTASEAFIAKKDFKVTINRIPTGDVTIPEPGTVVLLASMLVGAVAYRRYA